MTDGGRVRRVAAFDFDGTVSRRDTLVPFVAGVVGLPRSVAGGVAAAWSGLVRREFDPRDRDELKAHMVERLLAGRSERELERAAGLYATKLLDAGLRPEVVDQVRRHVAAGHETLFVSASLVYYLRPIARHLHMTDVIAVEPEEREGTLTGAMRGPNVRAGEKVVRLWEWLGLEPGAGRDGIELWAYGNSSGDHELLAAADHAFWLGSPSAVPSGAVAWRTGLAL
jgi:phosphatidylglycerophosphatase C